MNTINLNTKLSRHFINNINHQGEDIEYKLYNRTQQNVESNTLFKSVGLPLLSEVDEFKLKYSNVFKELNVDRILIFKIKDYNGSVIKPKTFSLHIPHYFNDSIGNIKLVCSYFDNDYKKIENLDNFENGGRISEYNTHLGNFENEESNIVYLFSDSYNNTSKSWSLGETWNKNHPEDLKKRKLANINTDVPCGFILIDAGIVVITNQEIINTIPFEQSVDGKFKKKISFLNFEAYQEKYSKQIVLNVPSHTYNVSTNTTYKNGSTFITSISLLNKDGEAIAYAVPQFPIEKNEDISLTFSINLEV